MTAQPGKFNNLKVNRTVDFGLFLDGGEMGEILMPQKYVPLGTKPGDSVRVFVYFDSEDRPVATTEKPLVLVGQCAFLQCKNVTKHGAFLNWGLTKDLFIPFREQISEMQAGKSYVVYVFLDKISGRIVGSSKLQKHLSQMAPEVEEFYPVELLIADKSPLGYTAVFMGNYLGMLYENEVFQPLKVGDKIRGYIKKLRPDGKTDLCLQLPGMEWVDDMGQKILDILQQNGGYVGVTDKTAPEEIYDRFGMSKKVWKKAVGGLYKAKKVELTENGLRLVG